MPPKKQTPILSSDFNPKNIVFSQPKDGKRNSENVVSFVGYKEENGKVRSVRYQTPVVTTPFPLAVREVVHGKEAKKECKLLVTFKGKEENPPLQKHYEDMCGIDKRLKEGLIENHAMWLPTIKGEFTEELIENCNMVRSLVYTHTKKKDGKETVYEPSITYDIPLNSDGVPQVVVTDSNRNIYSYEDVKAWTPFILVTEINAVWKVQSRVGETPKVTHILLTEPPEPERDGEDTTFNFSVPELTTNSRKRPAESDLQNSPKKDETNFKRSREDADANEENENKKQKTL